MIAFPSPTLARKIFASNVSLGSVLIIGLLWPRRRPSNRGAAQAAEPCGLRIIIEKMYLASAVQRMAFEPCFIPEKPAKRERNLPVLIAFGARSERPGVSQQIASHLDKIGHLAAGVGFRLRRSVRRRHDASFWSGGSYALVTDRCLVRCGGARSWLGSVPTRWSILLTFKNRKRPQRGGELRASASSDAWGAPCVR